MLLMRNAKPYTYTLLPTLALLLLLGGCRRQEVVYAKPSGVGTGTFVLKLFQPNAAKLLQQGILLRIDTTTTGNGQALAAVVEGKADFTSVGTAVLLTNSLDTTGFGNSATLRALAPRGYLGYFSLRCHKDLPKVPVDSLVRGRKIYCGQEGSASHRTAVALLEHLGVPPTDYSIVGNHRNSTQADSIIFFAENIEQFNVILLDYPNHEIRSLQDSDGVSLVDGFVRNKPYYSSTTLPAYSLGHRQPNPIVLLTASIWFVCRADLPTDVAYELARAFNPAPSAGRPTLEEVDLATLPFPLHEGARQYRERDRPSFVQRNAEVLGLLFTLGGLLAAGGGALVARQRRRTSRRFDALYTRVAQLELACAEALSPEVAAQLAQEVKTLQHQLLHDMAHHHELTESRAALLQQKLSSCLGLLHQTTLLAQQRQA